MQALIEKISSDAGSIALVPVFVKHHVISEVEKELD